MLAPTPTLNHLVVNHKLDNLRLIISHYHLCISLCCPTEEEIRQLSGNYQRYTGLGQSSPSCYQIIGLILIWNNYEY